MRHWLLKNLTSVLAWFYFLSEVLYRTFSSPLPTALQNNSEKLNLRGKDQVRIFKKVFLCFSSLWCTLSWGHLITCFCFAVSQAEEAVVARLHLILQLIWGSYVKECEIWLASCPAWQMMSTMLFRLVMLLLLLVTRLLPRDGGMAEHHGAPEAGQLPRVWIRGCKETESRQRVSGANSPLLDRAEWDERCPGTSVHKRCKKDSRFCQS